MQLGLVAADWVRLCLVCDEHEIQQSNNGEALLSNDYQLLFCLR